MQRAESEELPSTYQTLRDLLLNLRDSWCAFPCPCIWKIIQERGNRRLRTKARWNRLCRNLLRRYYNGLQYTLQLHRGLRQWHRIGLLPVSLNDTVVPQYYPWVVSAVDSSAISVEVSPALHCLLRLRLWFSWDSANANHPEPKPIRNRVVIVQASVTIPVNLYRHPAIRYCIKLQATLLCSLFGSCQRDNLIPLQSTALPFDQFTVQG